MEKTNILVILTDQLTWRALKTYGDRYSDTPAINSICEGAAVFGSCYTPFPLCQPARAAFWTSLYPHETGVLSNGQRWPVEPVAENIPTLGDVFRSAGYHTVHFGKKHDAGSLRGFDCAEEKECHVEPESPSWPLDYDTFRDRYTTTEAVKYLEGVKTEDKPFLMVADFINPHNICSYIGAFEGIHDNPPDKDLPELPPNFDFDDFENRPLPVQYICCSHNRQAQTAKWTPENYRHYLAAYYRYTKYVDDEIQKVLDALEKTGRAENTLIVFFSDHGDSMASRRMVTKQVNFYEEITRVPFIFKGPGVKARHINEKPVTLLDLFPTLCGYAGIDIPPGLRGLDLSQTLKGGNLPERDYVISQWHTEWGHTIEPGRMLLHGNYKYIKYVEGAAEEFYDLKNDPWEKTNIISDPKYSQELEHCRSLFRAYLAETGDNFENTPYLADAQWRSHKPGYQNHEGLAAPASYWEKHGRPVVQNKPVI